MTNDEVFAAALSLSWEERAELAELLLESLEPVPYSEWDAAWLAESRRRMSELRAAHAGAGPDDGSR